MNDDCVILVRVAVRIGKEARLFRRRFFDLFVRASTEQRVCLHRAGARRACGNPEATLRRVQVDISIERVLCLWQLAMEADILRAWQSISSTFVSSGPKLRTVADVRLPPDLHLFISLFADSHTLHCRLGNE